MHIRKAELTDLDEIMEIYARARKFMAEHGNATQWAGGYPSEELIADTIREGKCHVCMDSEKVAATFYFACEDDPTYHVIEDGAWLNDEPYAVVHRVAVAEGTKGAGSFCLQWALTQAGNIRIDTHTDNKPMQGLLKKLGFTFCGRIYVENGTARMAFQQCRNRDK